MNCQYCNQICQKAGKQRNGAQKLYCGPYKKYQQSDYRNKACEGNKNQLLAQLVCEGVSVRGIARVMEISINTALSRIKAIGGRISKPPVISDQRTFEVDELWTYIGRKDNEYWLAYALDKGTRKAVDFVIGKRTKATLRILINRLLSINPRKIRTDKLTIYQRLIPRALHRCGAYCINHIERKNLSIRMHIKRLSRRTICFSRSIHLLECCLLIYFWG